MSKLNHASSLKSLQVFCVAARLSSFKEASRELFITASAVSHQVKRLEQRIGFELFERRTRAVTLTSRGAALLDSVGPLIDRIHEEVNAAIEVRPNVSLNVVLPPFFATEIFIPRLAEFTDLYPHIDIYLDMADVRPSRHSLSADLSVILCEAPPTEMHAEPLFPLSLVPACAPAYSPDEKHQVPVDYGTCMLIVHRQRRDAWKRWFRQTGIDVQQTSNIFELDSMAAVVQSAEQGVGIALVPEKLSSARFQSRSLQRLPGKAFLTGEEYYISWQQRSVHKNEVAALVKWIKEIV